MKINNSEEHIKLAAQHFLSKNLEEIQETADKTMEGHQRIVFILIEIKKGESGVRTLDPFITSEVLYH